MTENSNPTSDTIEKRFSQTLGELVTGVEKALAVATTAEEFTRILENFAQSPEFKKKCEELAVKMVTQVNNGVSKTWREAARKAGRGEEIYNAIMSDLKSPMGKFFEQKVKENAKFISTFPLEISEKLNAHIARESLKGRRSSDILNDISEQFPNVAKPRLKLIARTEVSKTQTALLQVRSEKLGLR